MLNYTSRNFMYNNIPGYKKRVREQNRSKKTWKPWNAARHTLARTRRYGFSTIIMLYTYVKNKYKILCTVSLIKWRMNFSSKTGAANRFPYRSRRLRSNPGSASSHIIVVIMSADAIFIPRHQKKRPSPGKGEYCRSNLTLGWDTRWTVVIVTAQAATSLRPQWKRSGGGAVVWYIISRCSEQRPACAQDRRRRVGR